MRRSSARAPALIALVAVLLVACSSAAPTGSLSPGTSLAIASNAPTAATLPSAAPQNPAAQALSGYIAYANNGVVFLQWTASGGALTGSLSATYTPTGAPTRLQHENDGFTGTMSGGSVTLTFPQGLGTSRTWTGAFSGQTLTMSYPAPDGSLATLTFQPGTVADYNTAVSQLEAQVQQAQNAAAQASAAAAAAAQQQQQLAQEQAAIDSGSRAVTSDLASLPNDVESMQRDLANVPNDLANMQNDVDQTYRDLQAVIAEAQQYPGGNNGGVCTDASGVGTDAAGVATDEAGIETDGSGLATDIDGVQQDITTLQHDFSNLQAAEAVLPSYQPAGLPSGVAVSQAAASANTAVAAARQTFAGYLTKAKQMVATATGYAADAQNVCKQVGG